MSVVVSMGVVDIVGLVRDVDTMGLVGVSDIVNMVGVMGLAEALDGVEAMVMMCLTCII